MHSQESFIEAVNAPADAASPIYLKSLHLTAFRNYQYLHIDATDRTPVILHGHNGAGKTNILEAISMLMPGRGIRRAQLRELDCQPQGRAWAIFAELHGREGEVDIGTAREDNPLDDIQTDKRIVKIDGQHAKSHFTLARHMSLVWLTPQMNQLFSEGNSIRRRFLDRLVFTFDTNHASRDNSYSMLMRERNKLLQQSTDPMWLESLEQRIAEQAVAIAVSRLQMIEYLNIILDECNHSFPRAHLALNGIVEQAIIDGKSAVETELYFQEILANSRKYDRESGRQRSGTHRTELIVTYTTKNMEAAQCSSGEQKALLLSIILAQVEAMVRWQQHIPLLLLDEVAAHLDASRRLELFNKICNIGAQAWMTGTDAHYFKDLKGRAQFFNVSNGTIIQE